MPGTIEAINDPATRKRLSASSVNAFVQLGRRWELTEPQQLALLGESISRATLNGWKTSGPKAPLSVDQLTRISYLLGTYEGLQRFFRRAPIEAERWLRRPRVEPPFLGATPLDVMLRQGIPGLDAVRRFVDSAAGGPPSRDRRVLGPAAKG